MEWSTKIQPSATGIVSGYRRRPETSAWRNLLTGQSKVACSTPYRHCCRHRRGLSSSSGRSPKLPYFRKLRLNFSAITLSGRRDPWSGSGLSFNGQLLQSSVEPLSKLWAPLPLISNNPLSLSRSLSLSLYKTKRAIQHKTFAWKRFT